jgi:hypothetical protein
MASAVRGFFYVIRLEAEGTRFKLGWSSGPLRRLASFRCSAPTASIVACWPCERAHETSAIWALTRDGCRRVRSEVFDCDDLPAMLLRAELFFAGRLVGMPRRPGGSVEPHERVNRPSGTGSICQLPSGRWSGRFTVGSRPDGSTVRRSFSADTREEVEALLVPLIKQLRTTVQQRKQAAHDGHFPVLRWEPQ